ncbi:TPA: phage tail protein [Pseudomonas aeruginosa]|nr:phage tail protein [Pseudomonas aeruginosa]
MANSTTQFGGFLTNVGLAQQANTAALGIPWDITHMLIGDAGGGPAEVPDPTPSPTQQSLVRQVLRAQLNSLYQSPDDPAVLVAELVLPPETGGWWIRELGLEDSDGNFIAVAKPAPSYKPLLNQGTGRTQTIRMHVVFGNVANVTLKIDPSIVLATRAWVVAKFAEQDTKPSVLVATTANIALSGLQTVDGVALTAGARVLVKNQAAAKDNGIYVVVAGGAWTRSADADLSAEVTPGLMVAVEKGTINGDSVWQLVTDAPITLGVTPLAFEMLAGRSGVTVGTYKSVTVDKYGRIVAGSNPTTLAGYGITDAVGFGQYGVGAPLGLVGGSELNTLLQDGVYVYSSGSQLGHAPIEGASHVIVRGSAAYPHQELRRIYQNRYFFRSANKVNPTVAEADWEPWVEMLHTGNMIEATQEEAEQGAVGTKWMSPRRVFQSIAKVVTQATEAAFGWLKIATQPQVTIGTDDTTAVTPKKLRAAQATQAEAEAGALDNKLMTPLRAFQAFSKWLVKVTSPTDTTAGSLLTVGTYGLGVGIQSLEVDMNNYRTPGNYLTPMAGQLNLPAGWSPSVRYSMVVDGYNAHNYLVQTLTSGMSAGTVPVKATRTMSSAGEFSEWVVSLTGPLATQQQAEAGLDNVAVMTSLRVSQALRAAAAAATEVLRGVLRIGTQAEVDAGALDTVAVTPKKMRWGFAFSYNSNGYLVLPTWLGGLIFQWSNGQINAGAGTTRITLPIEFTTSLVFYSIGTSSAGVMMTGQNASPTGMDINARTVVSGSVVVPPGIVGYTFFCVGK